MLCGAILLGLYKNRLHRVCVGANRESLFVSISMPKGGKSPPLELLWSIIFELNWKIEILYFPTAISTTSLLRFGHGDTLLIISAWSNYTVLVRTSIASSKKATARVSRSETTRDYPVMMISLCSLDEGKSNKKAAWRRNTRIWWPTQPMNQFRTISQVGPTMWCQSHDNRS